MSWMNTIHSGAAPSLTTQVFYTGTSTLKEGYSLCYDFNAADVNSENNALTAIDVGEEYWNDARRVLVEKCTEKNKIHFAGVVAKESNDVVGPGWVTIHRPGSVCNVYAYSDCDHERSADGNASGQLLNVVPGQWYMMDGGFPGCGAAMVLQDANRGTDAGLIMAELMVGLPSGGFTTVAVPSATGSLSAQLSAIPVYCGVYEVAQQALASGPILSTAVLAADGKWMGQRMQIRAASTFTSSAVSVTVSSGHSTMAYVSDSDPAISGTIELSAADERCSLEWDGVKWIIFGGHDINSGIIT